MSELEVHIYAIILNQLGVEEALITPHADLVDDLGADSLDLVSLATELEGEFHIEIPDEALEDIHTVQDVVEYAVKHSAVKS